ncbi:MAG: pilus assembly protein MshP [Deltaproteobacteria bacterium]|nr:pilus assembly protein MshP [Deltaproteobacteria bacterium]
MTGRFQSRGASCREQGFTLVAVIFILVGLSALAAALVTLGAVESRRSVLALESAKAYHAARGGLEWGIARAKGGNCAASTSLAVPGAAGFAVTVTCDGGSASVEGGQSFRIYRLTAGAVGSAAGDPVRRRLEARVTGPMTGAGS